MKFSTRNAVVIGLLVVLGGAIGLLITPHGINWFMDAGWYLTYARSVRAGDGLTAPITSWQAHDTRMSITQWPPLFPLLLALGSNLMLWARFVAIASLAVSGVIVYFIGRHLFKGDHIWAFATAILFMTFPVVLSTGFSFARSEPPFTALSLLILLMLFRYQPPRTPGLKYSFLLALMLMLAVMLRYVGVAFVAVAGLVVGHYVIRTGWRTHWPHLGAIALTGVPLAAYMLYLHDQTGKVTGPQTTADGLNLVDIPQGLKAIFIDLNHPISSVLNALGLESNWWIIIIMLPVIAWIMLRAFRSGIQIDYATAVTLLFVGGYLVILWAMAARSDTIMGKEPRHYIVIYGPLLVLMGLLLRQARISHWLLGIFVGLWLISFVDSVNALQPGEAYNAPFYRDIVTPALHKAQAELPTDTVWYTMHTSYASFILGNDTPVRMFSLGDPQARIPCQELAVPGHIHAAFLLIDEPMLRRQSPGEIHDHVETWFAVCGTIMSADIDSHMAIISVQYQSD